MIRRTPPAKTAQNSQTGTIPRLPGLPRSTSFGDLHGAAGEDDGLEGFRGFPEESNTAVNVGAGKGRGMLSNVLEEATGERPQSRGRGSIVQNRGVDWETAHRMQVLENAMLNLTSSVNAIRLQLTEARQPQGASNLQGVGNRNNLASGISFWSMGQLPNDAQIQQQQRQEQMENEGNGGASGYGGGSQVQDQEDQDAEWQRQYLPREYYKPIPVKEWDIKFSGDGKGLRVQTFVREMERMAQLQGVRMEAVLSSLHLCLTGDALIWYRSNDIFLTWREFAMALKYNFGRSDCDLAVRRKIEERKQKDGERVGVYISAMKSLFRELELGLDESTKLQLVRRNLSYHFRDPLLFRDFETLEELEMALHRVEQNLLLSTADRPKVQKVSEIEVSSVSSQPSQPPQVSKQGSTQNSRAQGNKLGKRRSMCMNCFMGNHRISDCTQPRRADLLCYGCGAENVIKRNCPNCKRSGEGQGGN